LTDSFLLPLGDVIWNCNADHLEPRIFCRILKWHINRPRHLSKSWALNMTSRT